MNLYPKIGKTFWTILSRIETKKIRTKHYESFVRTRVFHARPTELSRAFLTMNLRWARGSPFSSSEPHYCSGKKECLHWEIVLGAMGDIFSIWDFLLNNFVGWARWARWARLARWAIFSVPSVVIIAEITDLNWQNLKNLGCVGVLSVLFR